MTVDPVAFTRFEQCGWSQAAEGYQRFFSPVTGLVADPLLDGRPRHRWIHGPGRGHRDK
jgi:hypothetical protein